MEALQMMSQNLKLTLMSVLAVSLVLMLPLSVSQHKRRTTKVPQQKQI